MFSASSITPIVTLALDLPEETLPGREVGALEECVLQDTFHPSKSLYHVCPVVVQVPQLAVVTLVCPPERILFQHLQYQNTFITFAINNSTFDKFINNLSCRTVYYQGYLQMNSCLAPLGVMNSVCRHCCQGPSP